MGRRKIRFLGIIPALVLTMSVMAGCSSRTGATVEKEPSVTVSESSETEEAGTGNGQGEQSSGQVDKTEEQAQEETSETESSDEGQDISIEVSEDNTDEQGQGEGEVQAEVNTDPKDVDLIFFMGQSNMSGCGGDYTQAPSIIPGAGYEFRPITDPFNLHDIAEPFGFNESVIGGIWDVPGAKRGSLVTSFVNEYHQQTGRTVIAVSASAGGTTTENWLSSGFVTDLSLRLKNAQDYLNNNGYKVKNQYVIWLQGESDALHKTSVDEYKTNMDDIMRPLFIGGFTKVFIITPGQINTNSHFFDNIIDCQIEMCKNSGYYALASTVLCDVPVSYMVDEWHYNQKVLNLVGADAAEAVAYYTNEGKEKCIYDYKHDETYIPLFFDYSGDETVEQKDIAGILAQ